MTEKAVDDLFDLAESCRAVGLDKIAQRIEEIACNLRFKNDKV